MSEPPPLAQLGVGRSTFYERYRRYLDGEPAGPLLARLSVVGSIRIPDLEREIGRFVDYYNNERVHESLGNLSPADVYHGRHGEIQTARQLQKMQTLRRTRWYNQGYELKDEELIRPSPIR